ncbi:MAG: hypothetical protein JWQ10_888 [Herbaspirillum sp.]|nr:hypothetical protein [Herbaspirillum sp.]
MFVCYMSLLCALTRKILTLEVRLMRDHCQPKNN